MAEVPDHLVPTDGLTNSKIAMRGLDVAESGGANVHFEMTDEDGDAIGTFSIHVHPQPEGTTDAVIATAHRKMVNVLRQWLHGVEMLRKVYTRGSPD